MTEEAIMSSEEVRDLKKEIVQELKEYIDRNFDAKLKEYLKKRKALELFFL